LKHLKITFVIVFVFVTIVHLLLIINLVTSDKLVATKKETVQKIDLRNVTLVSKPKVEPKSKPKEKVKPTPQGKPKEKVEPKPKPRKKIIPKPKPKPKKKLEKRPKPVTKSKVIPKPKVKHKTRAKVKPHKKVKKSKPVSRLSASKAKVIKSQYIRKVKSTIERKKYYPKRAKRLKHEGTVKVRFTILKDGSIKNVTLAHSSRYKRLNSGALQTLKRIGKFPLIPKALHLNQWEIVVPIEYILR